MPIFFGSFSRIRKPARFTKPLPLGIVGVTFTPPVSDPAHWIILVPVGIGEYRIKGEGMVWQQVRRALMASVLAAAAALTVRAEEKPKAEKAEKIPAPAGAAAPAPIAPGAQRCSAPQYPPARVL